MVRVDGKGNGEPHPGAQPGQEVPARQRGDPRPAGPEPRRRARATSWPSWGPSGSGKTTLLNLLGGLDVPTSRHDHGGRRRDLARCRARKLTAWRARHVGLHLPDVQPHPGAHRVPERRAAAAADPALARPSGASTSRRRWRWSASPTACSHYPRQLSGGQEQRVAIARAIVTDPTLPALRRADRRPRPHERRRDHGAASTGWSHEHGKTVLMVTHDPRAAERAHAVLHLDKGVLVEASRRRRRGMKYLRLALGQPQAQEDPHGADARLVRGGAVPVRPAGGDPRGVLPGGVEVAGADRLVVINRTSLIQPLPISYRDRLLAGRPASQAVTFAIWFGGVYQDEQNFFPQFAIDPRRYRADVPGVRDPRRAVAGVPGRPRRAAWSARRPAKRFGWKLGDRIPIKGTIFPGTWEFNIRAHLHRDAPGRRHDAVLVPLRRTSTSAAPQWFKGAGRLVHRARRRPRRRGRRDQGHRRALRQLRRTRPRPRPRRRSPPRFVKQMGNIELLILAIGGVVFFTLLLVTGNTMAIAVRERTGELAVLKTVGFSDRCVLGAGAGRVAPDRRSGRRARRRCSAKAAVTGDLGRRRCPACFYLPPLAAWPAGSALALLVGLAAGLAAGAGGDAPAGGRRAAEGVRMAIPLVYNLRSVRQRWTLGAWWPCSASPARWRCSSPCWRWRSGFRATLVASGSPAQRHRPARRRHLRDGQRRVASSRSGSSRTRPASPARRGRPLVSAEVVVVAAFPLQDDRHRRQRPGARRLRRGSSQVRDGVQDRRRALLHARPRPSWWSGSNAAAHLRRASTSARPSSSAAAPGPWSGVFDAGGSAFDSEVWCDATVLNQTYQRPAEHLPVGDRAARLAATPSTRFKDALTADPRLTVQVERERRLLREAVAAR